MARETTRDRKARQVREQPSCVPPATVAHRHPGSPLVPLSCQTPVPNTKRIVFGGNPAVDPSMWESVNGIQRTTIVYGESAA